MLLRIIVVRSLGIWSGVHLTAAVVAAFAQTTSHAEFFASGAGGLAILRQSPLGAVLMLVVSGTLSVIDLRRRREEVLLANLGVGTSMYLVVGLVPMVIAELLLRAIIGG